MFKNKGYSIVIKENVYKFATCNQGLRCKDKENPLKLQYLKSGNFQKNGNYEKECFELHDGVD